MYVFKCYVNHTCTVYLFLGYTVSMSQQVGEGSYIREDGGTGCLDLLYLIDHYVCIVCCFKHTRDMLLALLDPGQVRQIEPNTQAANVPTNVMLPSLLCLPSTKVPEVIELQCKKLLCSLHFSKFQFIAYTGYAFGPT